MAKSEIEVPVRCLKGELVEIAENFPLCAVLVGRGTWVITIVRFLARFT